MNHAAAPSPTPDTSRRVLIFGGAAAVLLSALSPVAVLALPVAVIVLAAVVLFTGSRSGNRVALVVGAVASALATVGAISWWISWGQAFDYLDAGQAVPGSVNTLEVCGVAVAAVGVSLLAALWVWHFFATRSPRRERSDRAGLGSEVPDTHRDKNLAA